MRTKICCIFNLAPHYRYPIYSQMDLDLKCDFYFGDTLGNGIKLMDYKSLNGFKKIVRNVDLKKFGFMWQMGVWQLIFRPYQHYIITGSPAILSNWVLLIFSKIMRKKVYVWSHGLKKPARTMGDKFQKLFYRLSDKVLLYGDHSRNVMLKEGFDEDRLIPIYNSLDYNEQLKIREHLTTTSIFRDYFKNDNPVIIYIGRIQKSKKLDLLVTSLSNLMLRGTDCNLVFVGADVEEDNTVSDLVTKNKLIDKVWFYGPCYDEDQIGQLLYNSSVCVSPGPVGLTALHALTYGCPVISNDDFENQMPEYEVIRPGKNGDYFENDNIESLTTTIENWINIPLDRRNAVRQAAVEIIDQKWNPNNQIKILQQVLNLNNESTLDN